jgi:hypothetical protein
VAVSGQLAALARVLRLLGAGARAGGTDAAAAAAAPVAGKNTLVREALAELTNAAQAAAR